VSMPARERAAGTDGRPRRRARQRVLVSMDAVVGCALALSVLLAGVATIEGLRHWFVLPVGLCGCLLLTDSLRWARGEVDLLDPAGILSVLGVHFFFLAPLLHVAWNEWMRYVEHPPDWRLGLGLMGLINLVSLLAFRMLAWRSPATRGRTGATWRVNLEQWPLVFTILVAMSVAALVGLWARFGGPFGVAEAYDQRLDQDAFTGMGWLFALAENAAPLLAVGLVGWRPRRSKAVGFVTVSAILVSFLALRFLTAGMRGSRANIIWALFWMVGLIHLRLRPLTRKWIAGGLVLLVGFMYVYGYFKYAGLKGVEVLTTGDAVADESVALPPLKMVLLGDLARADVQALLMLRSCCSEQGLDLAWGRTYLASLALLTPRSLWPQGRPQSKVLEGTRALQGWTPEEGPFTASNVYGIAGECLLNFGPLAVPFAYALFGLLVHRARAWRQGLSRDDPRELLFPFVVSVLVMILVSDSDVVLYYTITFGGMAVAAVWLGSDRVPLRSLPLRVPATEPRVPPRLT
jgi:hypothetical protein